MTASKVAKLGFYEIVRPLAKGGMAELFLARTSAPQGFEKLVVLKKILPQFAEDGRCVRAFLDEAKLAAHLDHPHIVQVHDFGLIDGDYCYVMEYVPGRDLHAIICRVEQARTSVPIEHVVQIGRAIAAALHYAHERRDADGQPLAIVHRDVTPANILLSSDGVVKLLDFGVAKSATRTINTRVGTVKGTPEYMAPEQCAGGAIDRRADIYALGSVLAEMLEGAPRQQRSVALDAILRRACAHSPEARYQTAQELQIELEELARTCRLGQSPIALASYLRGLFDDRSGAWPSAVTEEVTVAEQPGRTAPDQPRTSSFSEPSQVATNVFRFRTTAKMTAATPRRNITAITALVIGLVVLALSAAIALGGRSHSVAANEPTETRHTMSSSMAPSPRESARAPHESVRAPSRTPARVQSTHRVHATR